MNPRRLRFAAVLLVLALCCLCTPMLPACPFCGGGQGQTLTKEVQQASLVVYGKLGNARVAPDPSTDLTIEEIVKNHAIIKDKRVLTLPRFIPATGDDPVHFLVFCDIFKDRVDPYRGLPCKNKDMATYLKGALALDEKDEPARLKFFFRYVDHEDLEVSTDAYREFANADYKHVAKMVQDNASVVRPKVFEWFRDKDTPTYKYGLLGLMLGLSGREEDAAVLQELLDDPQRGLISGVDGVLAGLVMVAPKKGWPYLTGILGDQTKELSRRYAALRTIRFFWEFRPDVILQRDLLVAATALLDQKDIADLAIEDLRRWQQWSQMDRILPLYDKESHDIPIVKRAVLRYMLSCPEPKAKAFIEEQRRKDPQKVQDVEELLKLDTGTATSSGTSP